MSASASRRWKSENTDRPDLKRKSPSSPSADIKETSGNPGRDEAALRYKEGVESGFDCDIVLMATGKRPDIQ